MGFKSEMIEARDEFIALVKTELLGPGSEVSVPDAEHELITTVPEKRYSIGILFPKDNKMKADGNDVDRAVQEEDTESEEPTESIASDNSDYIEVKMPENTKEEKNSEEIDDEPDLENNLDEEVSLAAQNMPSSFGITFFVRGNTDRVRISLKYGTYRKSRLEDCRLPFTPVRQGEWSVPAEFDAYIRYDMEEKTLKLTGKIDGKTIRQLKERDLLDTDDNHIIANMYKLSDQLRNGYVREPRELNYEIVFRDLDYVSESEIPEHGLLEITALRRKMENGTTSLTIMVVNKTVGTPHGTNCILQPELRIDSVNNDFVFEKYAGTVNFDVLDEEEQSLELQYRNKHVYGTGLGTAVDWNVDSAGAGFIRNDFFPECEVPSMDFKLPKNCGVSDKTLSMKYLSDLDETDRNEKINDLTKLVDAYSAWIDALVARSHSLNLRFMKAAEKNLKGCREACEMTFSRNAKYHPWTLSFRKTVE